MAKHTQIRVGDIRRLVREAVRPLPAYQQACSVAREAASRGVTSAFKNLLEALKAEGLSQRDVWRLQRLVDEATQDVEGDVSLGQINASIEKVLRELYTDLGLPTA